MKDILHQELEVNDYIVFISFGGLAFGKITSFSGVEYLMVNTFEYGILSNSHEEKISSQVIKIDKELLMLKFLQD